MPEQLFIVDITIPERAYDLDAETFGRLLGDELGRACIKAVEERSRVLLDRRAASVSIYPEPGHGNA